MTTRNATHLSVSWDDATTDTHLVEVADGVNMRAALAETIAGIQRDEVRRFGITESASAVLLNIVGHPTGPERAAITARGIRFIEYRESLAELTWRPDLEVALGDDAFDYLDEELVDEELVDA